MAFITSKKVSEDMGNTYLILHNNESCYCCSIFLQKVVHVDLAARNILISRNKTIKIGDFGLSRHTYITTYRQSGNLLIPLYWAAPELLSGNYMVESDVWSYGIVLYEIYSLGSRPYKDANEVDIKRSILEARPLPRPNLAPDYM